MLKLTESSARGVEPLLLKFLRRKEVCGDLLDDGLTRNMGLVWPLMLGEDLLPAAFKRPEGVVKVESASESLVSLVTDVCGSEVLD